MYKWEKICREEYLHLLYHGYLLHSGIYQLFHCFEKMQFGCFLAVMLEPGNDACLFDIYNKIILADFLSNFMFERILFALYFKIWTCMRMALNGKRLVAVAIFSRSQHNSMKAILNQYLCGHLNWKLYYTNLRWVCGYCLHCGPFRII